MRIGLEIGAGVLVVVLGLALAATVRTCLHEHDARLESEAARRTCLETHKRSLTLLTTTHTLARDTERNAHTAALVACEKDCEARLDGSELAAELADDEAALLEALNGILK